MTFSLPTVGHSTLPLPHFPTRHQAFVFRAAEFVSFARIADVLQTSVENVAQCAAQMGIKECADERVWLSKGYISVIRALWHILPYEQLLQLLEMNEQQLAVLLREEDFLDIKLGEKPLCEKVSWRPLTAAEQRETEKIKQIMRSLPPAGKAPFAFEYIKPKIELDGDTVFDTRMIYLFSGLYQTAFDVDSEDFCSDEMLESYQRLGINAVWTQGILMQLTSFPFAPELSKGFAERQRRLRSFTERLKKYGIKLFLYLNEPRFMPASFFEKYPDLRGHKKDDDHISLCTSTKEVQDYLRNAVSDICKAAPELGGFFTITRSENLTNCYSHSDPETCTCPRCKNRSVGEVIGEVIGCIRQGVDRVDPSKKVIAWSWSWKDYNLEIIRHLPRGVILQSQSEDYVPFCIGGVNGYVRDYSMGIIGPGKRAKQEWEEAQKCGLETSAKVQVNTTWEGSTVPALPLYPLMEEHIEKIKDCGVRHLMLSWTLGGYPSENLMHISKYFTTAARIPKENETVRAACEKFCEAFKEFPFHMQVLYYGPQNAGPANLLFDVPTGYNATMTCFAYDDVEKWRGIYPLDVFENQFRLLCEKWEEGLALLEGQNGEMVQMAYAAYCLYKASYDQLRFYGARARNDGVQMALIAKSEEETARKMLSLMDDNASIGFEAANHYYFTKFSLCEKILNCMWLQEKYKNCK